MGLFDIDPGDEVERWRPVVICHPLEVGWVLRDHEVVAIDAPGDVDVPALAGEG